MADERGAVHFITTQAELPPERDLRSRSRYAAVSLLAGLDALRSRSSALARPRVQILLMHHVFDDAVAGFRRLLAELTRYARLTNYSEAMQALRGPAPLERPMVCVSFDDGLHSCLNAAAVLEEFDARGMFFINPAFIDASDARVADEFCRRRIQMPPSRVMSWRDLEELVKRGHEIGNHTAHHIRVAAPDLPLEDEIAGARELLRERLGSTTARHFAWTYGRFEDFSRAGKRVVFDTGHESIASGQRGAHVVVAPDGDLKKICLRRDHVVLSWPLAHNLYFLARSARRAGASDNEWPETLA